MVTGGDRSVEEYLPDLPGEGWPHVTLSGMGEVYVCTVIVIQFDLI